MVNKRAALILLHDFSREAYEVRQEHEAWLNSSPEFRRLALPAVRWFEYLAQFMRLGVAAKRAAELMMELSL